MLAEWGLDLMIKDIIIYIFGILASLLFVFLIELRKRLFAWIDSHKNSASQNFLHSIAEEAFSLVEQRMKGENSVKKFNFAYNYISEKLKTKGIQINSEEISAAIEKAVVKHNKWK